MFLLIRERNMNNLFNDIVQFYGSEFFDDSLKIINLKALIKENFIGKIDFPDSMKEYVSSGGKVFLYISEGNCGSCIEECFTYLNDLGNKIGQNNFFLMGNFHDKKTFEIYKHNASMFIENSLYYPNLNLPEKFTQQPLLFVLDKKLNVRFLYVPDYYPEYIEEYFTKLLPGYFGITK